MKYPLLFPLSKPSIYTLTFFDHDSSAHWKKGYHTFNCPSFFNSNLLILGWSLSIFPRSPLTRPYTTTTTITTTIWNEISFVSSTLSILRTIHRLLSFDKLIVSMLKNLIFSILISPRVEKEGKRRDRAIFIPFYRRQPNHCSRYRLLLIRVRVISVRLGGSRNSLQWGKRSQWPVDVLARVVTLSASFLRPPMETGSSSCVRQIPRFIGNHHRFVCFPLSSIITRLGWIWRSICDEILFGSSAMRGRCWYTCNTILRVYCDPRKSFIWKLSFSRNY